MRRRKHRSGDWHHRVPDFKMVYCGSKKRIKEAKQPLEKRIVEVSVTTDKNGMVGNWSDKIELKKVKQQH
jgi:hypothetical protein